MQSRIHHDLIDRVHGHGDNDTPRAPLQAPSWTGSMNVGDIDVARIGLGTNRLTKTAENVAFVKAAVTAGVQMIDTAHSYTGGESEETIGAALSSIPKGCMVATKGGIGGPGRGRPEALRDEIEQSLRRLRTDQIPLYYLHRVDPQTPLEKRFASKRCRQSRDASPGESLLRYVDPDQARGQRQRVAVVERERKGAVAVGRGPVAGVVLSFVEDFDPAIGVHVVIVNVRAMSVADVQQLLTRVQLDDHLDAQRLVLAGVLVRMSFLGLGVGAGRGVVGVDRVVLVHGKAVDRSSTRDVRAGLREHVAGDVEQLFRGEYAVSVDQQVVGRVARSRPVLESDLVEELRRGIGRGAVARRLRLA